MAHDFWWRLGELTFQFLNSYLLKGGIVSFILVSDSSGPRVHYCISYVSPVSRPLEAPILVTVTSVGPLGGSCLSRLLLA